MNKGSPRTRRAADSTPFRIALDGRWSLPEFGLFTRVFDQAYSIVLVIEDSGDITDTERRASAFRSHPWRGSGFSAANFYHEVRMAVPRSLRPRILHIQYASPGFMDLGLYAAAAISLSKMVKTIVASFREVTDYYNHLYTQLHARKLTRIKTREAQIELMRKESAFVREQSELLSKYMSFEHLDRLRRLTDDDLSTLKILLGLLRYLRQLAKWELSHGATLHPPTPSRSARKTKPTRQRRSR